MNRFGRPTPVRCAEVAVEIRKISGVFAKTFHTAAKILFLHGVFLNYVFYRLMGHAGLAQIEVFKILKTASGNVIDVIEIIPISNFSIHISSAATLRARQLSITLVKRSYLTAYDLLSTLFFISKVFALVYGIKVLKRWG